jgi:hypothetical protein
MRRILAVAALGVALSAVSACADPVQDPPGSSPSATQSKAALADKKTTCDAYLKLQDEFDKKVKELTPLVLAAQTDKSKYAEVFFKASPALTDYETRLTPIAAEAGDTTLKPLLDDRLRTIKGINADIKAAGVDQTKLEAVGAKVATLDDSTNDKLKTACSNK